MLCEFMLNMTNFMEVRFFLYILSLWKTPKLCRKHHWHQQTDCFSNQPHSEEKLCWYVSVEHSCHTEWHVRNFFSVSESNSTKNRWIFNSKPLIAPCGPNNKTLKRFFALIVIEENKQVLVDWFTLIATVQVLIKKLKLLHSSVQLTAQVPDTITSWVLSAISMSKNAGFGILQPNPTFTVFKPFFVEPNLPFSVKRGEVLNLDIAVYNYLDSDQDVVVSFERSDGFLLEEESGNAWKGTFFKFWSFL